MSVYLGATLIGDDTEVLLEPADTERLVDALDELLEILDDEYRVAPDGPALDALEAELDALRGLRDAIHSVVVSTAP
jgi:hypothetical protein